MLKQICVFFEYFLGDIDGICHHEGAFALQTWIDMFLPW